MSTKKETGASPAKTKPRNAKANRFDSKNYNSFTMLAINDPRPVASLVPKNPGPVAEKVAEYAVELAMKLDEADMNFRPYEFVFCPDGNYTLSGPELKIQKRLPDCPELDATCGFMEDNKLVTLMVTLTEDEPICVRWSRDEDKPVEYVGVITY